MIELRVVAGRVAIERGPRDVKRERRGELVVAVPDQRRPKLTASKVAKTIVELLSNKTVLLFVSPATSLDTLGEPNAGTRSGVTIQN